MNQRHGGPLVFRVRGSRGSMWRVEVLVGEGQPLLISIEAVSRHATTDAGNSIGDGIERPRNRDVQHDDVLIEGDWLIGGDQLNAVGIGERVATLSADASRSLESDAVSGHTSSGSHVAEAATPLVGRSAPHMDSSCCGDSLEAHAGADGDGDGDDGCG